MAILSRGGPKWTRAPFVIAAIVSGLILLTGIDVFTEGAYVASLGAAPGFVTAPFWQLCVDQLSAGFRSPSGL
ncbi:MAG TPA: hypothetical protein VMS79_04835 [Methanomassiliicoccales archaeon]|nr:hypothetical protein [Methanomassiliicoccales archaeon]